jgi:hypothetical protein
LSPQRCGATRGLGRAACLVLTAQGFWCLVGFKTLYVCCTKPGSHESHCAVEPSQRGVALNDPHGRLITHAVTGMVVSVRCVPSVDIYSRPNFAMQFVRIIHVSEHAGIFGRAFQSATVKSCGTTRIGRAFSIPFSDVRVSALNVHSLTVFDGLGPCNAGLLRIPHYRRLLPSPSRSSSPERLLRYGCLSFLSLDTQRQISFATSRVHRPVKLRAGTGPVSD